MMLIDMSDLFVAQAVPILYSGRKRTPSDAAKKAKAVLKHRDIVGVQQGQSSKGVVVLALG